jgi:hypothetical protein
VLLTGQAAVSITLDQIMQIVRRGASGPTRSSD